MFRALSRWRRWLALPLAGALALPALMSCSAGSEVRSIKMALDGSNDRPRTTFYPDTQTLYCNVEFVGQRRDTTLQIYIRQNKRESAWGGNLENCNVILGAIEAVPQTGSSIQSLQAQHPQPPEGSSDELPFPVGEFTCEVVVNGVLAGTAPFKITYPTPDCPPIGAIPGTSCRGWHKPNAKCSQADQAKSATCNPTTGVWDG